MTWSILVHILQFLGALGIFIFGMKLMSDSLQHMAGNKLRSLLAGMTRNRITAMFTGLATTAVIQSSSATTVMLVSFVNAGLLSLLQASGVILGANIGTTVTAWLVSYFGFRLNISLVALALVGLVLPLFFSKRFKARTIAEFVIGFTLLFLGLEFMRGALPDVQNNPELLRFLEAFGNVNLFTVLLFVGIGTLLTIFLQTSSISLTVTMVMVSEGWIPFELGAAMVLGENIGTTVTANIAAIVANIQAKRAARFHTLFNVIGVIWILSVFSYMLQFTDWINQTVFQAPSILGGSRDVTELSTAYGISALTNGLAIFHTMFNVINAILLIGIVDFLLRLVVYLTPTKAETKPGHKLQYLSEGLMSAPEMSLQEARKEIQLFGKLVEKMCGNIIVMFFQIPRNKEKLYDKISNREMITDRIQDEISKYLARLGQYKLSEEGADEAKNMMRIANELERMGDTLYKLAVHKKRLDDQEKTMPESIRSGLEVYFDKVYRAVKEMNRYLGNPALEVDMEVVFETEDEIDEMRDALKQLIYDRMENGQVKLEEGMIYNTFINSAEKLGDYVLNVNQALAGMK